MTENSDLPSSYPRAPIRKRGIERFELLLDATAAVIAENPEEDVSLAQIAERADVPLASVYHFFPNRNAAFVALAQRYHRQIVSTSMTPDDKRPKRWQDVFDFRFRQIAAFLNSEPAALRLLVGTGVSVEVRNVDFENNAEASVRRADYLRSMFDIPSMPNLEKHLAVMFAVNDGIWALSYSHHRCITPDYLDESIRAAIAYLRCYLPEHLEPRPL